MSHPQSQEWQQGPSQCSSYSREVRWPQGGLSSGKESHYSQSKCSRGASSMGESCRLRWLPQTAQPMPGGEGEERSVGRGIARSLHPTQGVVLCPCSLWTVDVLCLYSFYNRRAISFVSQEIYG